MLKKLQLRVCGIVSVRVLFFISVDMGMCRLICFCILYPFLTAKSSNAARSLRAKPLLHGHGDSLTHSPIIFISCVVPP